MVSTCKRARRGGSAERGDVLLVMIDRPVEQRRHIQPTELLVHATPRPAGVVEGVEYRDGLAAAGRERLVRGLPRTCREVREPGLEPGPVRLRLGGELAQPRLPDLLLD